MKSGGAIDAECEVCACPLTPPHSFAQVADIAHVYTDNSGRAWTAVLGKFQIETDQNSFYKLQLLQHDTISSRCVYKCQSCCKRHSNSDTGYIAVGVALVLHRAARSWKELTIWKKRKICLRGAVCSVFDEFACRLYEEKSGNPFELHNCGFVKKANKMYPIEVNAVEVRVTTAFACPHYTGNDASDQRRPRRQHLKVTSAGDWVGTLDLRY